MFWITEVAFLIIAIFSFNLYLNAKKSKKDFIKKTGIITIFSRKYQNIDERHLGKMRFLKIDNNNEIFEVFIGKESGDFAPKFEKMDQLKINDIIDIYCLPNSTGPDDDHINRLIQYIDRNGKPIFIKGSIDKLIAGYIMEFCFVCMGIVFFLKLKGFIL